MKFEHNRRLGYFDIGGYFASGEDYDEIMKSAGVKERDNDTIIKRKLKAYLESAGMKLGKVI